MRKHQSRCDCEHATLFFFLRFPQFSCFLETPLNTIISIPIKVVLVKEPHMVINKNLQSIWEKKEFSFPSTNEPCHLISAVNLTGLLLSRPNSYQKAQEPEKAIFHHTAISLVARVWHNAFALTSTASSSNVHRSHMVPAQLHATANLIHRSPPTSASSFSSPAAANVGNGSTFQVFFIIKPPNQTNQNKNKDKK